MTDPLLSVVIVTYNAAQYLGPTLRSLDHLLVKLETEIEVIVVDGGSTDATVSMVHDWGHATRVTSESDDGIYDAMNKGAESARGYWIQFLNAGDAYSADADAPALVESLNEARKSRASWLVMGARNLHAGRQTPTVIRNRPHVWFRHMLGLQPHCHQATLVSNRAFSTLGGFRVDSGSAADYEFIVRLGATSPPVDVSAIVIDYLGGGVSEESPYRVALKLHRLRVRLFQLDASVAAADAAVTVGIAAVNAARINLGRLRRAVRQP